MVHKRGLRGHLISHSWLLFVATQQGYGPTSYGPTVPIGPGTLLDEWSACCRDLYLTTHNTHQRRAFMTLAVFEPACAVCERPQTHTLDGAATAIDRDTLSASKILQRRTEVKSRVLRPHERGGGWNYLKGNKFLSVTFPFILSFFLSFFLSFLVWPFLLTNINLLNTELNPICYLLALLAHHFLHVSRIRVKSLTLRLLMSYIYMWSTYSWCF